MVRAAHAGPFCATGELPSPSAASLSFVVRDQSFTTWIWRLAAYAEGNPHALAQEHRPVSRDRRCGERGHCRYRRSAREAALADRKPARPKRLAHGEGQLGWLAVSSADDPQTCADGSSGACSGGIDAAAGKAASAVRSAGDARA